MRDAARACARQRHYYVCVASLAARVAASLAARALAFSRYLSASAVSRYLSTSAGRTRTNLPTFTLLSSPVQTSCQHSHWLTPSICATCGTSSNRPSMVHPRWTSTDLTLASTTPYEFCTTHSESGASSGEFQQQCGKREQPRSRVGAFVLTSCSRWWTARCRSWALGLGRAGWRCHGHRVGFGLRRVCRAVRHVDASAWGAHGSGGLWVSAGDVAWSTGCSLGLDSGGGWGPCCILHVSTGRAREIFPGRADFACNPAYIIIHI